MQEATAVVKQARQFQAIVNDPRFQAWAKSLNENPKSTSSNDTADDEAEDAPLTAKHLQKLEEKITSKMEERDRAEKQERYNRVMIKRANQFKKDNPDWKLYANRMDDILEDNPKLSYEDALFLAKKSTMQKQNKMAILKSKKNAKSLKPTTSEGSDTNKTTGKRTFQQAAQDAINSLTKQGFKIPR
jgi:hypothetical protein